ncbi:hypothetical protein [Methylocystis parvus]|uniref:Uncharacterized protein n=1 Tax=Methylocystis parvus TaxID=134 RepID=A0A6B8MDR0_9HYPH|nr:hypothetical protein [Methylocystis parvus]QGM99433.1 hypothetical protein F7D14_19385 [Methylocystis parvus]WBK00176.1 hypothetical protein MMG94_00145 [Methylocystis parvus OBBP]
MKRILLGLALCCAASAACAAEISSAYAQIDIRKDCRHRAGVAVEDYGDWRCKGYAGMPIWFGAGDQRMYVSFGKKAKDEPAAGETLGPFNDFYDGTIEWRLTEGKPFAAIMRWNYKTPAEIDKPTTSGRVLVVTRLPPGTVCHVGYVDARANPDANELAREIADKHAKNFVCGRDKPVVLGKAGPELK